VVDLLFQRFRGNKWNFFQKYLHCKIKIGNQSLGIVKPLTFMNLSGDAVVNCLRYFDYPAEEMIVSHDDLDLDLGRIKIKHDGAAGGHKGLLSVIHATGLSNFTRIRIGIGKPADKLHTRDYVLESPETQADLNLFNESIMTAVDAVESLMFEGLIIAMNKFNKRIPAQTGQLGINSDETSSETTIERGSS
jgi:peptidyl-tRNA hydrolase, PTH1 family